MPLIRPELTASLKRSSEVLAGLGVVLFGVWALQANDPFFQALAALVALAGLGLAVIGWRRMRFKRDGVAPGVVQLDEGQVSYFGPEEGGFLALRTLAELHLIDHGNTWLLISTDGTRLEIPVAASGADGLFDAFATLPDLRMQSVIEALDDADPPAARALWLHSARRTRHGQLR